MLNFFLISYIFNEIQGRIAYASVQCNVLLKGSATDLHLLLWTPRTMRTTKSEGKLVGNSYFGFKYAISLLYSYSRDFVLNVNNFIHL